LRTGIAGRSFRGRTYLAGLIASEVVNNQLDGGRALGMVSGLDQVRQDMAALNFFLVVVSRVHNGAPRVTGVATTVTSILAVDNRVDTQRRRLD